MVTPGHGAPASPPLPLPRPRFLTGKRVLVYAVLAGLSYVALTWLAGYFLSDRGTAELTACTSGGRGSKGCSVVYTTDGGERGTDRYVAVRQSDEPGDTIPVRVRDGEALDARFGANELIVLVPMVLVPLTTAVCLGTPPTVAALRSSRRARAERALRGRGEEVWHITVRESGPSDEPPAESARVFRDDGVPCGSVVTTHPGPGWPPSAARFDVADPDGRPRYTVGFRTTDPRRPEVMVSTPDGTVLAVVRPRLFESAQADIQPGEDPGGTALATVRPCDRLGVERAIELPDGARVGTLLALPTVPGPTLLGLRPGAAEPLLAGALGLALARERFYPRRWLEAADARWAKADTARGGGVPGHGPGPGPPV